MIDPVTEQTVRVSRKGCPCRRHAMQSLVGTPRAPVYKIPLPLLNWTTCQPLRHHYIIDLLHIKSHQNQGSRRNFNDDSNCDAPGGAQRTDPEEDSSLSGSYGGSGRGQAGGYTGSQGRAGRQGQQSFEGDEYCDTDPGMAGNRGVQDTQDANVPGEQMPGEYDSAHGQSVGGDGRSRGYERDTDEYDDSGIGSGQGAGTGAGAGAGRGPKVSMSSKMMGGMEKMAGKLSHDPKLEAKGEQRKTGF
ncbi:hypothetical protein DFH29DRAFT_106121 [Suillus ampliporus]|nr:hypothetical protein DFH29DRAFT_106121 [Suillus ampliporus]